MRGFPAAMERLTEQFARLPGIGGKTAQRLAFYMLSLSVNTVVICGIFTAGGDTAFDAYSVAVTMWLMILPAACAAAFWWHWPPMAVYLILSMDEVIKISWVYAHYRKHRWLRNTTREDAA